VGLTVFFPMLPSKFHSPDLWIAGITGIYHHT
jgi:hypothetical protein